MSLRPAERACRPRTSVFDSRTVGTVWWWPSAVPPSRAVSRGALPLEHGEAERPVVSGEPPITENVITAHVACFVAVLAQHHRGLATENRPEVCLRDGSVRYRHPSYESGADPYRLSPRRATRSRYRSMSSRRRYSSSLRRRPTSFSRPRRDEWSLSCAFRCSVSAEIRVLITAICTSAEPVSASERRCDWMISAFWVFVSVMTSGKATRRSPSTRNVQAGLRIRSCHQVDDVTGPPDVFIDRSDEIVGRLEPHLRPKVCPELHRHLPSDEVAVEVQ